VQYHPEAAAGPHDAILLFDDFRPTDRGEPLMPRREDIDSVLVIGSGPIVIGQACEFDYSGTQACRVLRAEGMRVILVNSNPATIMTDPEFADATYIEPITPEVRREDHRQGASAMHCLPDPRWADGVEHGHGAAQVGRVSLERYDVELIGADVDAIERGENREKFREIVAEIGRRAPDLICHTLEECLEATEDLGYPVVVRPSFTMGGAGSGIASGPRRSRRIAGLACRPVPRQRCCSRNRSSAGRNTNSS
jgi:carbamoyl-phosphate synthase large subunit